MSAFILPGHPVKLQKSSVEHQQSPAEHQQPSDEHQQLSGERKPPTVVDNKNSGNATAIHSYSIVLH